MDTITKTDAEWREELTPEQFHVLRQAGTERAFSGALDKVYDEGTYNCAGCALPLFSSDDKFNSGSGWPSFSRPIEPDHVTDKRDVSHGMVRTESLCARCGGHLGHVFPDGPPPTGQRYCMNSVSLDFVPADATAA